jgi:putative endonuclease
MKDAGSSGGAYSRWGPSLRWDDVDFTLTLSHGFRMAGGWIYVLCNKPHGVIYIGVTADLARRVWQHRNGEGGKFTRKHHCYRLVYVEPHDRIEDAIAREKAIKAWLRVWKLRLIQEHNPLWEDMWERIVQ